MKDNNYFPMERNRYYYGKLLTVRDFEQEQDYFRSKERLNNRVVHGAGVVCGLGVTASDNATLLIESGMALDYAGREVVIPEPQLRKLQMLEGYDSLRHSAEGYLCLSYAEENVAPVNAVGTELSSNRQFNSIREGYRLYLSAERPDYPRLLEAAGEENVKVIFSGDGLTLILSIPGAVCVGEEFYVTAWIVKNDNTPPVQFTLEGENAFAESENGRILLSYRQGAGETRQVIRTQFRLRAQALSGLTGQLFPAGAELNVEMGSHHYKNYINIEGAIQLCPNQEALEAYRRSKENLEQRLMGADLPLYLAKLELIHSTGGVFLSTVTDLPFGQRLRQPSESVKNQRQLQVTTHVRTLDYWKKPEVQASYHAQSDTIAFDFAIPTPEQYDYRVSHGVVELELPGGIRVNSRCFSEEIPHGLGAGPVDVRLSIEYMQEEPLLLVGNSEVFKSKQIDLTPPWVEAAAIVYPQRGTMRIGVWLHDTVEGNRLRVHFHAQKPEKDNGRLMEQRQVTVTLLPEVARVARREQLRLRAVVDGSADSSVIWSVKEENGGTVDTFGVYQAPELPGIYEITATAGADPSVQASTFVIVE